MTKQEQIDKWEKKIQQIVYEYKYLRKRCQAAEDAGVLNANGYLYDAIWSAFDSLLEMIDHFDWIQWYLYENNCGAEKMEAGHNGKLSKITTPRQLAQLIVEGENRNAN